MQEAVYFCINKILLISVRTNDFYDDGWKKIFSWKKKKKEKKINHRPWQDSNLQSSDPKSDALSVRPHGHLGVVTPKMKTPRTIQLSNAFKTHKSFLIVRILQRIFVFQYSSFRRTKKMWNFYKIQNIPYERHNFIIFANRAICIR